MEKEVVTLGGNAVDKRIGVDESKGGPRPLRFASRFFTSLLALRPGFGSAPNLDFLLQANPADALAVVTPVGRFVAAGKGTLRRA